MRKFELDNKIVHCPRSSCMGFSYWKCVRGDIIIYKEFYKDGSFSLQLGRSLGRVICEKDALEDCTGHICAVVPDESFTHAFIRWIDPQDVGRVSNCPRLIPSKFFGISPMEAAPWPKTNKEALELARHIDQGYWSEPCQTMYREPKDK